VIGIDPGGADEAIPETGCQADPAADPVARRGHRHQAAARLAAGGRGSGTPLAVLVDHIVHVVEVAGIDHVGLGSDFDGVPFLPVGLDHVGDLPNITVELVRRGFNEEQIGKILGGNILRVMAEVEQASEEDEQRLS
jgi:membrane dipeptidase